MQRPTVLMVAITALLLFLLAGCIVDFRPDGDIYVDFPPYNQGTIPRLTTGATLTETATAPGTIPPITITVTSTSTPPVTATITVTVTATVAPTSTRATTTTVTPIGTPTLVATAPTAQPTGSTATPPIAQPTGSTSTPATAQPTPSSTATRPTTPSATATPSRTATASPTRTPTGTPTRAATPTLTVTATAATPPATPTAIPGTVFLGSHQGFATDASYVVVGEVVNGESFPVFNVKVIGSFYDSSGNLVAAQESMADLTQIEPELSSPVKLQVANSGGSISRYELTLVWDEISIVDYEELTILRQEVEQGDGLAVVGELRNDGSVTVKEIVTVVTFYDSAGQVVEVAQGTVSSSTLAPNATATYRIQIADPDLAYDHFTVQAQGALQLF